MISFIKGILHQYIIVNIAVFSCVTTLVFAVFIKNLDSDVVRVVDEKAFDILSTFVPDKHKSKEKIKIFKVDDVFLKNESLMDETNRTNTVYGEFLPRRYLTKFISNLDEKNPKLLFIDYTLNSPRISITNLPIKEEELTKAINEEETFIKMLNKQRNYPIYLVHNENYNYIEQNVFRENVKFVSTMHVEEFTVPNKYVSYIERKNSLGRMEPYYYAPLKFLDVNVSTIIKPVDVINNRFIYKTQKQWGNIKSFSFFEYERYFNDIDNAMIFLGEAHSDSKDKYKGYDKKEIFGIDILANNVMSIAYFNPQLKLTPFIPSLILIFFIALLARILSLLVSNHIALFIKKIITLSYQSLIWISIFIFIFFFFIINMFISWILLVYGKIWFSYAIGYVFVYIIQLIL